jgi:membrane-bound ClpP family serine protease
MDNQLTMNTMPLVFDFATLAQAGGAQAPTNTNQLIVWAVVLVGMAAAFLIAEMFVPSGGLLGACSLLSMIGGVVMLFRLDTAYGVAGVIVSLIAIPIAFMAGLYIMPRSWLGRALTLGSIENQAESAYDGQAPPQAKQYEARFEVGAQGEAMTELRPVGNCLINGERCECLAESGVIPAGTKVRVVHADGMQIKVRPIDGE